MLGERRHVQRPDNPLDAPTQRQIKVDCSILPSAAERMRTFKTQQHEACEEVHGLSGSERPRRQEGELRANLQVNMLDQI